MKNFFVLLFLLPMVIACKKEYGSGKDTHTYYDLTAEQLAKTPYFNNPAFDTLQFVSNKGDTLTFAKLATVSSYYKTANNNCPDCPTNYYYFQELKNTYQTIQGEGKFEVRHVLKGDKKIPTSGISFNFIEINFLGNFYSFFEDAIGDFNYKYYLGKIITNNVEFKDCHYEYSGADENSKNIGIFSSNYGFVKAIDSTENNSFLLLRK